MKARSEVANRRLDMLRFLAESKEPVMVRDLVSACGLEARLVRLDLRELADAGYIRRAWRRGELESLGKAHTTKYLIVSITAKGRREVRRVA